MDLGFDTIGNATLICYDKTPVLCTDPWIQGSAYFGSWTLSHTFPQEQLENLKKCPYVWISHGHPDHLNQASLPSLRDKQFFIPDHYGKRIFLDLSKAGFKVKILKNFEWIQLSKKIHIMSLADPNQDGILLVKIGDTLILNLNDTPACRWKAYLKKICASFSNSFLMKLSGYGDADMNNFYREDGSFIEPRAAQKNPIGPPMAHLTDEIGARYFIPFSSMHRYQRTDSAKMNQYVPNLSDYAEGYHSESSDILPAFTRYDVAKHVFSRIDPPASKQKMLSPESFGDCWDDLLDKNEKQLAQNYFQSIERTAKALDFINLRVGKKDFFVSFRSHGFRRGVTFEAPRHSLMAAIRNCIFDDLLIGNFIKVTLHGNWPYGLLYPHFCPYVTKYADNGGARTQEELDSYSKYYLRRLPWELYTKPLKALQQKDKTQT